MASLPYYSVTVFHGESNSLAHVVCTLENDIEIVDTYSLKSNGAQFRTLANEHAILCNLNAGRVR